MVSRLITSGDVLPLITTGLVTDSPVFTGTVSAAALLVAGGLGVTGAINASFVINVNSNVTFAIKIGTAVPVVGDAAIMVARTITVGALGGIHAYEDNTINDVGGGGHANASFSSSQQVIGTFNYLHFAGFQSRVNYGSSGTVDHLYGHVDLPVVTAGTVTNRYGVNIWDVNKAGGATLTNNYGLYIKTLNQGTNNYAIFTEASTPLHFGGAVAITDATASTTTATGALTVAGGVGIVGDVNLGGFINVATAIALNSKTFAQPIGAYHQILDQAGNGALIIGSGGDPQNYYRNTAHVFGNIGGGTIYGTWGVTGLAIDSGVLSVPVKGNLIGTFGGTIATGAVVPADACIQLYSVSAVNWAGVGCDNNGVMWFRTGLAGTPAPAMYIDTSQVVYTTGTITIGDATALIKTSVAMNNGAGASAGTITNAPAVGNPTKWIPINDNGNVRYIPAW